MTDQHSSSANAEPPMTDAATLLALAGKVAKLAAPCRETDALIAIALNIRPDWAKDDPARLISEQIGRVSLGRHGPTWGANDYTASLDAAMTLMPVGAEYQISTLYGTAEVELPLNGEPTERVSRRDCDVILAFVECCLHALAAQATSVAAGKR